MKTDSYKPRVMVVDDDSFMLSLVGRLLSSNGYRVFEADRGDMAIDIASREPLDLVLLDLLLPGEDGYSVCRRIKAMPINSRVPIVFLTGMRSDQDIEQCYAAGGVGCVIKPFEPDALLEQVKTHIDPAIPIREPVPPAPESVAKNGVSGNLPSPPTATAYDIRVQSQPFDIAAEQQSMWSGRPQVGAMVSFVGLMRDINAGDRISRMTLEHYPGMTEKALRTIAEEAAERWQIQAIRIVHRVGTLTPQDPIVLVAVTARHRGEAFRACEFLIDYLKTRAPFWKKETTDKGERWVEARVSDEDAAERWNDPV